MNLPTELEACSPRPHHQLPQLEPRLPSGAGISLFREVLALLLDQNDGDMSTGTEGGLTCLWPLEGMGELGGRERREGRKERRGGDGELHMCLWQHCLLARKSHSEAPSGLFLSFLSFPVKSV